MRRDQKKQAKRKKRERKIASAKQYAAVVERKRRRMDQYPQVFLDTSNGNPEFVEIVRKANSEIGFDDPDIFSSGERYFYRLIREYGFQYAHQALQEAMKNRVAEGDEFGQVGDKLMLIGYGTKLLERIPEVDRRRLMPYNDVRVMFQQQKIVLKFSSMLSQMGSGGTVFHSRREPTVEFDGKQWTVAFSRHAITRICERLNPRYTQYAAAGDVHAFFSTCNFFEPVKLHGDQPAFVLYDMCYNDGYAQYETYVRSILGEENVDPSMGKTYYRVGYCPIVFEGGFAKAKTFLYPGYRATPEYGLMLRSQLSRSDRELLIQSATSLDADEVILRDNPETIKWFHDHGVPQVVHLKQEVFAL